MLQIPFPQPLCGEFRCTPEGLQAVYSNWFQDPISAMFRVNSEKACGWPEVHLPNVVLVREMGSVGLGKSLEDLCPTLVVSRSRTKILQDTPWPVRERGSHQ